ncbi:MAG: ABC transporter permease subunit [Chloroflexota bacterium]|nr:MAG: ABC transporter permease subunit [Chloroflexota bacterium]
MFKLLLHELRLRRWAILGWGIGMAVFAGYIIILYPDFAEPMAALNLEEISLYQIFGDFSEFASFTGFVSAEVLIFLPLLLAIYAIVNGTGTLAGEEDNGTLEPIMALPLPRWQLVMSKAIALGLALLLILLIVGLAMAVSLTTLPGDIDTGGVTSGDMIVVALAVWPLVGFFAMFSLFLGAFVPSRRIAAIIATVILVFSYFGNNLASLVDWLERIQPLLPFYYFDSANLMKDGPDTQNTLILLAAGAVSLVLALVFFQLRNVTVGAWPWQRARIPSTQ